MCWLYSLALALQTHDMHAGPEMALPDELSLFNHHLAGGLVILLAALTYLEESKSGRVKGVKYLWPLPLLGLSLYLLIRSDSELTWPPTVTGWLHDPEAIQHKIFAVLALGIGLVELFRRTGHLQHAGWRYVFYGSMFVAAVFLLFHSGEHHTHIIHQQHLGMASAGLAIGAVRVLSDIKNGIAWLRVYLLPGLILVLGLLLVFYRE